MSFAAEKTPRCIFIRDQCNNFFPPDPRIFISQHIQERTTRNVRTASKRSDGQERKLVEVKDALDDFCNPLGVVAVGRGFVVHAGRIHSYPPRGRSCRTAHSTDHGQKSGLTARAAGCKVLLPPGKNAGGTTEYARNHEFEVNP
jgi:hypothetical protein